ncbi:MAG: hypothetical protein IE880_07690 [Epsilonproteobacteria bacterium]|nr:hypothetical protein [Campylobacterota bacterium]
MKKINATTIIELLTIKGILKKEAPPKAMQYRIAYEVLEDDKIVFHYMVATRENFYKKLENRV